MKFVIVSHNRIIPGYGVKGPILSPAEYDIHLVLRWIAAGLDVREVMPDGSHRKLKHNDARLMEELNKKIERQTKEREELKKAQEEARVSRARGGFVRLVPEAKPLPVIKTKPKKVEEPKKEEPKVEEEVKEEQVDLFIDQLENPEE